MLQILGGLAVGLVFVEVGFRLRDKGAFPHLNVYVSDDQLGVRLAPHRHEKISFSGNPVTQIEVNSDGYRGVDWTPASNEILVVGDSQVFGLGVEDHATFSAALATKTSRTVRNAGVPTYGPAEYNAVLAELLPKRKPKTVIWTVNLSNDLFEAAHANSTRHRVWDGWAVRKENAPAQPSWFPGRSWLMRDSHAMFALRGLWYRLGSSAEDGGVPSEGTWKDLRQASVLSDAQRRQRLDAAEADRQKRQTDAKAARRELAKADFELQKKVTELLSDEEYGIGTLRAAHANPGDIVRVYYGEGSRPIPATAEQIKLAAEARQKLELKLKETHDQVGIGQLAQRDKLDGHLKTILSTSDPAVHSESVLRQHLVTAKALCDANGAELVVLVLPLDVQVSSTEWAKYHVPAIDLSGTRVLVEDVLNDADELGARGVDAWPALAAAEPGAFLDGDLHMTPKGHAAVAELLARAMAGTVAAPKPAPPPPVGRSAVPTANDWRTAVRWPREKKTAQKPDGPLPDLVDLGDVKDGERLFGSLQDLVRSGCTAYLVREWVRISCKAGAAVVEEPGRSEAMVVNTVDGTTVVAAFLEGDRFRLRFFLPKHVFQMSSLWPLGEELPELYVWPGESKLRPTMTVTTTAAETALCACHREVTGAADCSALTGTADADCARTYAGDCAKILRCARGDGSAPPQCAAGQTMTGVTHRCTSPVAAPVTTVPRKRG